MNIELISDYYDSFIETMTKNEISPEAFEFAGEAFQGLEEMYFGFMMFLIT